MGDTHTWTFADGQTRDLTFGPHDPDRKVLGLDPDGRIVISTHGHTFGLTLCCNASDKGVDDGIVCRGCYGTDDIGVYDPEIAVPVT